MNLKNQASIVTVLRQALSNEPDILLAYLFGSHAKSQGTRSSDIDVAVLMKPDNSKSLDEIELSITKATGFPTDRIQLIDLSRASVALKYTVPREGVKIIEHEEREAALISEVTLKYPEALFLLTSTDNPEATNIDLVNRRITVLRNEAAYLRRLKEKTLEEIVSSEDLRRAFERAFEICVVSMLDICKHVVAAKALGVAETYGEYVGILIRRNAIPEDLGDRLLNIIKWRNPITHRYIEIEYSTLWKTVDELINRVETAFITWALDLTVSKRSS